MSFLADRIGEMKATSFIARNTFVIMQVHLLLVNIPNMVVFWKINHGATQYPDFPVETFIDSAWTAYNSNARLIGFFCGLVGSLLIALGIERVQAWYRMRKGIN